jgi:hypothetical protein
MTCSWRNQLGYFFGGYFFHCVISGYFYRYHMIFFPGMFLPHTIVSWLYRIVIVNEPLLPEPAKVAKARHSPRASKRRAMRTEVSWRIACMTKHVHRNVIDASTRPPSRVGNKVSMIYIMDICHDFIMIFCGENIMIYIDENIRTILL